MPSSVKIDWSKIDRPEIKPHHFPTRRSVVYGTKGMVASSQPLATEAGLEILRKGGNAADAAVATSVALNVTEPTCCGVGGDAFCLFYDAKTKVVKALNGSGRSPAKLDIAYARSQGFTDRIPLRDLNSVTVPGAAAAWVDTVEHLGSGAVTAADVFAPAIRLAEEGVPISELTSLAWQASENVLKDASPNAHEMLLNGKAPLPGQVMRYPTLAQTFREIATHGKDGFYKGRVAQAIVDLIQSRGGVMELDDLARHTSTFVDPIKYVYADELSIYECPPNGQGITALLALGILENMQDQALIPPLLQMEHNSAEYLHALIEALRLAFADSQWYVTDPDVVHVPVKQLLSKEYLASRAKIFRADKATQVAHGNPVNSSDTVYFTVTDQWGNACSFIQSNYTGFGSAAIPAGCGFTLQNRGNGFILDENHPNSLKGNKRPYHTIIPSLVTRGDELFMAYGVMGGYMQPQGHVQVLLNMLRGFTPQAAIDAPRFCISPGLPDVAGKDTGNSGDANSEIYLEESIPLSTVEELRAMGHDARRVEGFGMSMLGRGQIIQKVRDQSGLTVWAAGSDPRGDGHAAAQI